LPRTSGINICLPTDPAMRSVMEFFGKCASF
jgi:hypothetical protein